MTTTYGAFIKELRTQKGISQAEMAKKLGISRASYIAVEQGKRELTLGDFEKVASTLGISLSDLERGEVPDYEKYKQMILVFLRMDGGIMKTKLAKLVYLSDFAWYYEHLFSMSGMQYRKITYGPVPDAYLRALDELEEEGKIVVDRKVVDDKPRMCISESLSNKRQKLNKISSEELVLMEAIYNKWKKQRTAEIVNFTHQQLPYALCAVNELIPYELITQEDPDHVY